MATKKKGKKSKPIVAKKTYYNRKEKGISPQQLLAVDHYFACGFNKREALLRAGYSEKTAEGNPHSVFNHPFVVAEVERRQKELAKKNNVTAERIVQEFAKIGFSNLGDLVEVNPDGSAYLDMRKITPEQRAALSEFTVDEYEEGRGEGAVAVKKFKIKFHDKKGALDSLARHLGMFNDKVEVSGELSIVERLQRGRDRVRLQGQG